MNRISIGFYPETYTKLEKRAKEKRLTLAEYTRQIVELGLRLEEMSAKKEGEESNKDPLEQALNFLKKLAKKEFATAQETLYLTRYILGISPEKNQGDHAKMLEAAGKIAVIIGNY